MTKRTRRRAWLAAVWWAAFGFGCSGGGSSSQVLTGRIDTTGVVAIRAVVGTEVVTAAEVGRNGAFRIALPSGARYRLEVMTSRGVKQVLAQAGGGWKQLELGVCVPSDPFDLGMVGDSGSTCDAMTDPNCTPPTPCMDPTDPNCMPPPCTDPNDPTCGCQPDGSCPPPPCSDPMDPSCMPPPCGGPNDPPCPPEPCMDPTDPWCPCEADGSCPCTDPNDPSCMGGGGGCMPGDPNCSDCEDPSDPETCKDPCVIDPMSCGCTSDDPNCWPPPEPPVCAENTMDDGMCDPGGTMTPEHVPGDFGCVEVLGK